jgi:hypothetical protein
MVSLTLYSFVKDMTLTRASWTVHGTEHDIFEAQRQTLCVRLRFEAQRFEAQRQTHF